jgi:hypothetical protein
LVLEDSEVAQNYAAYIADLVETYKGMAERENPAAG